MAELWLCAITIGEIAKGTTLLQKRDPEKARQLTDWREKLEAAYINRILPFDTRAARRWGEVRADFPNMSLEESMIASIAQVHNLTVVTRNTRGFAQTGLTLIKPFD